MVCADDVQCFGGVFFFFQAEDGIRDHAQSRGLGDVYKRQREQDIKNMDKVVRLKLAYNPDLIRRLISTDGEIIEDVTSRNSGSASFWGAAKQEDGTWVGTNALGLIWMKIRDDLQKVLFV
eukprot:TRINITY_DN16325_c0_g1_i2.p1 TRINITY_DN16325_c0_g1~~TRINITY_DN16325_c0_g1_i2.p1  ORF type:complete len:121 (+),score=10.83 TRINITY_DN16325_c0_g1_i2:3-365(+)